MILGVIPARGDSKGIPRKNIRLLAGKPLLAWSIEAAWASKLLDRTVHKTILTPFPSATEEDFRKAIEEAAQAKPDVLVLVEFGGDMVASIRQAERLLGNKKKEPIPQELKIREQVRQRFPKEAQPS